MKKIILFIMMICTVTLMGCNSEKTLKIGFSSTLTGSYAYVGNYELYGAQYAVDEINAAGGINGMQVELVVKDDEANPDKAVQVDNDFLEEGIDIIIGHGLSIVASSILENAEDKEVLFLSPSIGTDAITNLDDSLIRNVSTTYFESRKMVESIIADNPTKVLMVYNLDNWALTEYHRSGFINTMIGNGYTEDDYETYGFYSGDTSDYENIEEKLSSGEFDTLMIASSSSDAAPLLNYIDVNNIEIDIHLSSWAAQGILGLIGTEDSNSINSYFSYAEQSDDPDFVSFKTGYEEKHSVELQMVAVNAYDIMYMLKTAIEHCESTNAIDVKAAIIEIQDFNGIAGEYSINSYGDCLREIHRMNIVNGKFELRE